MFGPTSDRPPSVAALESAGRYEMANNNYPENDPRYHTTNVRGMFDDVIKHLREDTQRFNEPKAQAMFETAAEVLTGLRTAFEHYENGSEDAMKTQAG